MHKQSERDQAVRNFNNPNHKGKGMITNMKTSGTSINMQEGGADILFAGTFTNAQMAQQASGRVLRIGQLRKCTFYVLSTNYSYDQALSALATNKMVPIIASQADIHKYTHPP